MKISDRLFKKHILENTLLPQPDSQQFMAYIILSQKYPNLTYWSMDGYSCDALADYSIGVVWNREDVIDWKTKEVMFKTGKSFWDSTVQEIINVWTRVNGETTTTKYNWLYTL